MYHVSAQAVYELMIHVNNNNYYRIDEPLDVRRILQKHWQDIWSVHRVYFFVFTTASSVQKPQLMGRCR